MSYIPTRRLLHSVCAFCAVVVYSRGRVTWAFLGRSWTDRGGERRPGRAGSPGSNRQDCPVVQARTGSQPTTHPWSTHSRLPNPAITSNPRLSLPDDVASSPEQQLIIREKGHKEELASWAHSNLLVFQNNQQLLIGDFSWMHPWLL